MFDIKTPAESRWVSVIFLQAEDADRMIGTISRRGPAAGIEYLRQWDHGDETTDVALTNGYVYDRIPAGSTDRIHVQPSSPYALTYSTAHRYVSLLRRYPTEPIAESVPTSAPSPSQPSRVGRPVVDIWGFARQTSTTKARHTVAM
jgi:hypothetical protein